MASADILVVENESKADPTHGIRVSSLIMETISSSHEVKRRKVTHEAEYQVDYILIIIMYNSRCFPLLWNEIRVRNSSL